MTAILCAGTLTACGQPAASPQNLQQTAPAAAQTLPIEHILCAKGNAPLAPACTLDREHIAGGETWTIRHPDGSFRRLVAKDGQIETADGAEPLREDGRDAVVADERYRLPTR